MISEKYVFTKLTASPRGLHLVTIIRLILLPANEINTSQRWVDDEKNTNNARHIKKKVTEFTPTDAAWTPAKLRE